MCMRFNILQFACHFLGGSQSASKFGGGGLDVQLGTIVNGRSITSSALLGVK